MCIEQIEIATLTNGKKVVFANPDSHYEKFCEKVGDELVCKCGRRYKIEEEVEWVRCGSGESYSDMESRAISNGREYQFYKDLG